MKLKSEINCDKSKIWEKVMSKGTWGIWDQSGCWNRDLKKGWVGWVIFYLCAFCSDLDKLRKGMQWYNNTGLSDQLVIFLGNFNSSLGVLHIFISILIKWIKWPQILPNFCSIVAHKYFIHYNLSLLMLNKRPR